MKTFCIFLLSLSLIACDDQRISEVAKVINQVISKNTNNSLSDDPECKLYEPVCGVDNNSYDNVCAARSASVEVAYKSECNTSHRCKSDPVCGVLIDCVANGPVCGIDGKSYLNEEAAKSLGINIAYNRKCFSESKFEDCQLICYGPPSAKESMCADDGFRYPSECWAATLGKYKVENQDCKEGSFECLENNMCPDGTPCKKSGLACAAYDKEEFKSNNESATLLND